MRYSGEETKEKRDISWSCVSRTGLHQILY